MVRRILLVLLLCLIPVDLYLGQSTVLVNSTVLVKTTKLGLTLPSPGWTYLQDTDNFWTNDTNCTLTTSCTIATISTTASSIRAMSITTGNNVTITHVCEGVSCSGTNNGWQACPAVSLTLTSVNTTGVFQFSTGGIAASQLVGTTVVTTGFVNGGNNLTGTITANTTSSFTVSATTVTETHAGTGSISDPCHAVNSGNDSEDAWFSTSGSSGITSYTVAISGTPTSFFDLDLIEWLPPLCGGSPCSASLDGIGTNFTANCVGTCNGGIPAVNGTDVALNFVDTANFVTAVSAPWFLNTTGNYMALNTTTTSPMTFQIPSNGYFTGVGISFKTSANTFPVNPPQIWTQINSNSPAPGQGMQFQSVTCNPTCNLTVASTGSAHLLVLYSMAATNGNAISSVSGGGTWVVPSGANTCKQGDATINGQLSCAYVISSTSGVTTVTPTVAVNGTYNFQFLELNKSTGTPSVDAQAGAVNSSASTSPSGVTASLVGPSDICFQALYGSTAASDIFTVKSYPWFGGLASILHTDMGMVGLMNTAIMPKPVWLKHTNDATIVSGICFN